MTQTKSSSLHTKETLALYFNAAMQHKTEAVLSLLLPISAVFTNVLSPFFASKVIASLIVSSTMTNRYFASFVIVAVLGLVLNKIGVTANMKLQARVMSELHDMVFDRLLRRSAGFYADRVGGKIVSDALDFVNAFSTLVIQGFIKGFGLLAIVTSGLVLLSFSSLLLGLVVLLLLVVIFSWTIWDSNRRKHDRVQRLKLTRQLTSHLSDSIVNAITVKTFAAESTESAQSKKHSAKLRDQRLRDWTRATQNENSRIAVLVVLQIGLVYILIQTVHKDPAILGAGIFAFTYTLTLLSRFFEINSMTRQIDEAILNASSMTQILSQPDEITDTPGAPDLQFAEGKISLDHVTFAYPNQKQTNNVFKDFSLTIKPGEKVGLVGHSGGGKSTLTRLLLRFDDVTAGAITIDGQSINDVTQASLRRIIGYVPQEPLLFHRSIFDNIRYGKPDATLAEVRHAANLAHAEHFIDQLPEGFDTTVGERGVKLSGGQRQRIAIARAILKNAPILVLDEATSALDSESENAIQQALWELMRDKTTIVVAHRLSTIRKMDRIIVIDNGRIVEDGSHEILVKKSGIYAKLWAHQSGGFIEE